MFLIREFLEKSIIINYTITIIGDCSMPNHAQIRTILINQLTPSNNYNTFKEYLLSK